jgi:hypothetical protein
MNWLRSPSFRINWKHEKELGIMIKRLLLPSIVLAAAASIAYTLNLLDQVVNATLYHYGLIFSVNWAIPYWNLLRIVQVLLGVIGAVSILDIAITLRNTLSMRKPSGRIMPSPQRVTRPVPSTARNIERNIEKPSNLPRTPPPASTVTPLVAPALAPQPTPTPSPSPIVVTPPAAPSESSISSQTSTPMPLISDIPGLIRCSHCGKAFTQPLRMLDFQGERPRIVSICPFCNEILPVPTRQEDKPQESRFQFRKKNNDHAPRAYAPQ